MKAKVRTNMLFFGYELDQKPYKYRLYFVYMDSNMYDAPRIHRLSVKRKQDFSSFKLGGVYTIEYKDLTIKKYYMSDTFNITESFYELLLHSREAYFENKESPNTSFYSFEEYKSLCEYSFSGKDVFLNKLMQGAAYFVSFALPITLYVLFLYLSAYVFSSSEGRLNGLAIPIIAVTSFPFVMYLMLLLNNIFEMFFLKMQSIKYYFLKQFVLRNKGKRRNMALKQKNIDKLISRGLICLAILVLSFVVLLLLP